MSRIQSHSDLDFGLDSDLMGTRPTEATHTRAAYELERRGIAGAANTAGASSTIVSRYYQSLTQHDDYVAGMELARRGNRAGANRLIQQAKEKTLIAGGDAYRGLVTEDIDVGKEFYRRDLPGAIAMGIDPLMRMTGFHPREIFEKIDHLIGANVLSKTTMMKEAETMGKTAGQLKPKRRRSGAMQHAIGFGAQEDAMSTIVKSLKDTNSMLKRTAGMIETLDKKINPGGPSSGGNATSVTSTPTRPR